MKMAKSKYDKYTLPPPISLGLPAKFTSYRPVQCKMVNDVTEPGKVTTILNAPTGVGKSLIPPTIAALEDVRVLVLTGTKLLQDVYSEEVGLTDVRGARNYSCPALKPAGQYAHMNADRNPDPRADQGPCLAGFKCSLKENGCPRYDAIRAAQKAQTVVTNYDCWLAIGKSEERVKRMMAAGSKAAAATEPEPTLGDFDYIILDELHIAASKVSDAIRIELNTVKVRELLDGKVSLPSATDSIQKWVGWAREMAVAVAEIWDEVKKEIAASKVNGHGVSKAAMKEARDLQDLFRVCMEMTQMGPGWVSDTPTVYGRATGVITFEPVWPAGFCERLLFRGIERRVGMSATIMPPAMKYLGLKINEFDFYEYDSPFPVENRLIWQWPAVQLNWRTEKTPETKRKWADALDRVRADRMDRKGLIHSVSYSRMVRYDELTRERRDRLVIHEPKTLSKQLEMFRRMEPPATFCSPAVDTGYDFAGVDAEYCIVAKIPYPTTDTAVMKARMNQDREYPSAYAADKIVQMTGRVVRYVGDRGESVIPDSTMGALMRSWHLFPKWWRAAVRYTTTPPKPIGKLK